MSKKTIGMIVGGIVVLGIIGSVDNEEQVVQQENNATTQEQQVDTQEQQEEARIQEEKEQEAIEELREHPVVVVASEPCIGGEYRIFDNTVHDNDGCNELRSRDIIAGYSDDEKFKDCVLCPKCFENAPSKKLGEIYEY